MMHSDKPARTKFKGVCVNFPNIALLAKSAMPGNIQVTFGHVSVGNKPLGQTVTIFFLVGYLKSLTVVYIGAERVFSRSIEKICLSVTEVLLHVAFGDFTRSKNMRYWLLLNAVLLPTFLAEAVFLDGETSSMEIINIFSDSIEYIGSFSSAKTS